MPYDELNLSDDWQTAIEEFFDVMDISEKQKEEREKLAGELFNSFLFLFALIKVASENDYLDLNFIEFQFGLRFIPIVKSFSRDDEYTDKYIEKVTQDVVGTSVKHLGEEYYSSDKRALGIAVNESNSIMNYEELAEAIEKGYTRKTWVTMKDNKVRDSHKGLEGKTIPITEYFEVGNSLLLFPRDEENCDDMNDISNCRCNLKFS